MRANIKSGSDSSKWAILLPSFKAENTIYFDYSQREEGSH